MRNYIGVKLIQAKPMTLGEYNIFRGWQIPANEDPSAPGYLVEYQDGYKSWSPASIFEAGYIELDSPNKITDGVLDRFIGIDAITDQQIDEKTTLVKMTPRTGFVQYEVSSCVDPANYDHQLGVSIATERLRNKLWPMLGFVLQWAIYGLKPVKK